MGFFKKTLSKKKRHEFQEEEICSKKPLPRIDMVEVGL